MATKKISELNALTTPESDDLIAIVDASATETKKITYGNISKHIVNVGTEVEEDSRINFIKSKNLFDKNNLEIAVYDYSTTGVVPPKVSSTTRCAVGPDRPIKVKPNTKYTFSSNDDIKVSIGELKSDRTLIQSISWTQSTLTFTTTANTEYIIFNINYSNSTTITSAIFITIQNAIMVNEGETATSYEPYKTNSINVDGETFSETIKIGNEVDGKSRVNVLKGKNLWNYNDVSSRVGVTSIYDNSTLTLNGTSTGEGFNIAGYPSMLYLKAGTYTLSTSIASGTRTGNLSLVLRNTTTNTNLLDTPLSSSGNSYTFTLTADAYVGIFLYILTSNQVFTNLKLNIQIEKGSTATTYEPFTTNEINIDNETFTDTLKVGTDVDNRSRVNVLLTENIFNRGNPDIKNLYASSTTTLAGSSYQSVVLKVKSNTTYTIKRFVYYSSDFNVASYTNYPVENASYTSRQLGTNDNAVSITTGASDNYIMIYIAYGGNTNELQNVINNLEVVKGTNIGSYTPYTPPIINVDGENEFFKNVYSTSEVVIGEWFGKPLYRKVYSISNPSSSNTDYGDLTSLNIDRLVHLYGYYKRDTGTFGIPFHDSDENYSVMFLSSANRLRGRIANASGVADTKVIIEYTKTTDA